MLFGKRKFSREDDDHCDYAPSKQVKITSPNSAPSDEVAMTDAVQDFVNTVPFPSFSFSNNSSSQLSILTSNNSPNYALSSLPSSSSASPSTPFNLYPEVETPMDVDMDAPSHHQYTTSVSSFDCAPGLLQPTMSSALGHGAHCTSIPRLRMSSHSVNGKRSMWSHCESCGAIEMVRS